MSLLAIGLGYCARHFVATRGIRDQTLGTTRDPAGVAVLTAAGFQAAFCDGRACDPVVRAAFGSSDTLLASAAPGEAGDPILAAFRPELERAGALRKIVYLSTIGVYGDHGGAWIDETAAMRPSNPRSRLRIEAEQAWADAARQLGADLFVLRLAGIYGPGRSPLDAIRRGAARRIVKPGQVFNRIHVEDVARAIAAAIASPRPGGVWNVADDEPSAPSDPIEWAAGLLDLPPPPEISFEDAEMTAMARSFWVESKRISNAGLKRELGVELAFPTYREGLRALAESEDPI